MNSTTSEERYIALTKLFHQHAFAHGRGDEFAEACAIDVAEVLALTRAGFDPTAVRGHELIARGFAARIERWRNGPPPPPHEVNKLLVRAWSWGAGPFLGQDVAA